VLKRLPIVAVMLMVGCSSAEYTLISTRDPSDGSTVERLTGNLLSGTKPWHQIELNLERVTQATGKAGYYFVLEYENRSVMFKERSLSIADDESLILIIDGARYRLKAIGGGSVKGLKEQFEFETARYAASLPLIQLMYRSSMVELLIHGKTNSTEKFFSQFNFEYLGQFLKKLGKP